MDLKFRQRGPASFPRRWSYIIVVIIVVKLEAHKVYCISLRILIRREYSSWPFYMEDERDLDSTQRLMCRKDPAVRNKPHHHNFGEHVLLQTPPENILLTICFLCTMHP